MSINYIAKCTHCDYTVDYKPDMCEDYRYHGLSKHSKYPKIEYAWCSQCNKFVPVQLGINMQKQKESHRLSKQRLLQSYGSQFWQVTKEATHRIR